MESNQQVIKSHEENNNNEDKEIDGDIDIEEVIFNSRQRALERIRKKKQELREKEVKHREYEKQKDLAPRLQWRLNLKERRRKFIEEQVNRNMFESAINLLPSNANLSSEFIVDQQNELIPEDHFNNDTSLDDQFDITDNTLKNIGIYSNNIHVTDKNNSHNNSRDHLSSSDKKEGTNINDISMIDSTSKLLKDDDDLLNHSNKESKIFLNNSNSQNGTLQSNEKHIVNSNVSTEKKLSPSKKKKNKLNTGGATAFRTHSGLGMLAHFINVGGEKTRIGEGLIDSLILVGPNIHHINSLMDYASFKTEDEVESDKIIRNMQPNLLYMTSDSQLEVEVDVLPSFCFPGGIRTDVIIQTSNNNNHNNSNENESHTLPSHEVIRKSDNTFDENKFFVFLLSNHTSSQYCVCMIVPKLFRIGNSDLHVRTFYCVCAITEFPFFTYLYHLMGTFHCMGGLSFDGPIESQDDSFPVQSSLRCVNDLALKLRNYSVPRMGLHLELTISVGSKHYEAPFFRSNFNDTDIESNRQILMWALPVLLSYIPLDQIISTIGYTVTEMRLVVCSSDPNILSACLLAIVNLLKPMRWVGPVIVTLPSQLMGYLDSPVPVVLGLQKLPEGFKVTPGMIIINPEERIVHLHHSDLVASHTLTLPQSSKLVKRLKPYVDGILELTTKWKKRSQSQASSFIWSGETYKKNIVGSAPLMSLDLRPDVEEGKQYISFINAFADEIADHLEAIVSTAIERVNEVDPDGINLDTSNKKTFSRKDIGDSGMNFIETLRETQMFSQYCFMELQKLKNHENDNELLATSTTLDSEFDEINHGSSGGRRRMDYDPLILLFTILLTGTQPLRSEQLEQGNKWDIKPPSSSTTSTPNRNRLNSTTRRRGAKTIRVDHLDRSGSQLFLDETIDWCNGRCNGRVDTPQCTGICLQIWEERMMMVRNQIQVKDMISKGNLLMTGNREVLQEVPGAKVIKRHKYETDDQYELRRSGTWCINNRPPRRTSALEAVKKYYCKTFQAKREIAAQRSLLVLKNFFARTIPRYKASTKRSLKGRFLKNIEELHLPDTRYYDSLHHYDQDSSRDAVGNSSRNTRKGVYNLFMHDWIVHSSWSVADNDYHRESIYNKKQANNDKAYAFIRDLVHGSSSFRFESNDESIPMGEIDIDNHNNNDELNDSIIQQTTNLLLDGNKRVDETPQQGTNLFDGLELNEENFRDEEDRDDDAIIVDMTLSPPSSRLMPPLNELGPAATDHLTPQQQSILLELYDNLSQGILVKKHGLSGKPRQRKLYVDSKLSRLLWRPIGINPDSGDRHEDFGFRVSLGFTKGDADRELYINEIREVTDDLSTDVMQRSLAKHYIVESYNARGVIAPGVISIVLADRTVDFEVGMDNWELIYHALKILVNFYQNVLPNYNSRYNSRGSL